MALPYARDITCSSCGTVNHVITTYGYGAAEETDTGECRQCKAEIARERCLSITVRPPLPEA